MTTSKSMKTTPRASHRLAMLASVAVLAMTVPVLGGSAFAEQGVPFQQNTLQPKKQPAASQQQKLLQWQQGIQRQQGTQNQNQAQQQQQNQAELQQQQQKAQQQKQAQQGQQLLKQQQQNQANQQRKRANQQQALRQQQERQAAQEQQLRQQQQNQAQQQQLNQMQQNHAQQQRQWNQLRQSQVRQQAQNQYFDWNTYRPGQRPPLWAQYRQNFDPTPYQYARNASQQYNLRYAAPQGWQYQRYNYGQTYPRQYWQQQSSWLNDYQQYGLQQLPYGYVWVQNGSDALAVDSFSGVILQAIYGLFSGGGGGGGLGGLLGGLM